MQVQEEVLKDPFKKAIPANSRLLAYGPQSEKDNEEAESPGLTPVERAGVIGGAVTLLVVLLYFLRSNTSWRPWSSWNFMANLRRFSTYYGVPDKTKSSKTTRRKSSTEKGTGGPAAAAPPPDQLALLSTAV